jgi:hypothetical protein
MEYIKDWCRILTVDDYHILIECYWKTDRDSDDDIHHEWVIKISTVLDRGRFDHIWIVCHEDASDMNDEEIIETYHNFNEEDIRPILKDWLELNEKGGPGLNMGLNDELSLPVNPPIDPNLN